MAELTEARKRRYMKWAADVELWKQSGLSAKSWCKLNGIKYEAFRTRKRKLQEIAQQLQCTNSEEQTCSNEFYLLPAQELSSAVEATKDASGAEGLKLRLTMGNICLELEGATNENLRSVIEVMRNAK